MDNNLKDNITWCFEPLETNGINFINEENPKLITDLQSKNFVCADKIDDDCVIVDVQDVLKKKEKFDLSLKKIKSNKLLKQTKKTTKNTYSLKKRTKIFLQNFKALEKSFYLHDMNENIHYRFFEKSTKIIEKACRVSNAGLHIYKFIFGKFVYTTLFNLEFYKDTMLSYDFFKIKLIDLFFEVQSNFYGLRLKKTFHFLAFFSRSFLQLLWYLISNFVPKENFAMIRIKFLKQSSKPKIMEIKIDKFLHILFIDLRYIVEDLSKIANQYEFLEGFAKFENLSDSIKSFESKNMDYKSIKDYYKKINSIFASIVIFLDRNEFLNNNYLCEEDFFAIICCETDRLQTELKMIQFNTLFMSSNLKNWSLDYKHKIGNAYQYDELISQITNDLDDIVGLKRRMTLLKLLALDKYKFDYLKKINDFTFFVYEVLEITKPKIFVTYNLISIDLRKKDKYDDLINYVKFTRVSHIPTHDTFILKIFEDYKTNSLAKSI
ncbi:hypothetical protein GVAV_001413 [Gurleya vavrai]